MHHRITHSPLRTTICLATASTTLLVGSCDRSDHAPAVSAGQGRTFEGSWNAAGVHNTVTLGPGRTCATIDLSGSLLLWGDGRPGVGFRARVIGLVDSQTGLVGRGVWTDERGDQVFSELKGEGTRSNNRVTGAILGGTGRYTGISGEYSFSWQSVIELDDSSIQGRAVDFAGRYRAAAPAEGGPQ